MLMAYHTVAAEEQKKWLPQIDFNIKYGNKRDLGRIGAFGPIAQTNDMLTYVDFRFMADSNQDQEGNFGLGQRWLNHKMGYITGVYGYFDRRFSSLGNKYSQLTFGAEYLSTTWDYRGNVYIPENKTFTNKTYTNEIKTSNFGKYKTVETSTIYVQINKEVPLRGIDIEAGRCIPGLPNLRLYAGGYYYQGRGGLTSIKGKQVRSQYTLNDYISLQAEARHDTIRKKEYYIGLEIHIPIGMESGKSNTLSNIEKRMTEAPVRDVDIVSNTSESTSVIQEESREITTKEIPGNTAKSTTEATPEHSNATHGFFSNMFCTVIGTGSPSITTQKTKKQKGKKQTSTTSSMNSNRNTTQQSRANNSANRSTQALNSRPYRTPLFKSPRPMQSTRTVSAAHQHSATCSHNHGAKSVSASSYRTSSFQSARTIQAGNTHKTHHHHANCTHSHNAKPTPIHSHHTSSFQKSRIASATKKEHTHKHHENCSHDHGTNPIRMLPTSPHSPEIKAIQSKQIATPLYNEKGHNVKPQQHHEKCEHKHREFAHTTPTAILDDTNDTTLLRDQETPSRTEDINLIEHLYSIHTHYSSHMETRYTSWGL